jgi:hypothetical protein
MNWEAIGALGEVGGAVAVVVTLVYLTRQIRQSTQATRVAAYHHAQQPLWSISAAISTDPGLAELWDKASTAGIDSLAPPGRLRLELALTSLYFGLESLLAHHEKGFIDLELWENFLENNVRALDTPLGREYLASRRGSLSRRLETAIAERVVRADAP